MFGFFDDRTEEEKNATKPLIGKKVTLWEPKSKTYKTLKAKLGKVKEATADFANSVKDSKLGRMMGSKWIPATYYTVKGWLWMDKKDRENRNK